MHVILIFILLTVKKLLSVFAASAMAVSVTTRESLFFNVNHTKYVLFLNPKFKEVWNLGERKKLENALPIKLKMLPNDLVKTSHLLQREYYVYLNSIFIEF